MTSSFDITQAMPDIMTTSINWDIHTHSVVNVANLASPVPPHGTLEGLPENCPYIMDTGSSVHILPVRADFQFLEPSNATVGGIEGTSIPSFGMGSISFAMSDSVAITLNEVEYVPSASFHLISIPCINSDYGLTCHFSPDTCWVTINASGATIAHGDLATTPNLYCLRVFNIMAEHHMLAPLPEGMFIDLTLLPIEFEPAYLVNRSLGSSTSGELQWLRRGREWPK
jgi:hypothetical protein